MRETILEKLQARGINVRVIRHEPVRTIADVEQILKIATRLMVKTMVLEDKKSGRYFVAALPADRRINWRKLVRVIGAHRDHIDLVDPDRVREVTGFEIGGIPPFGFGRNFLVVVDNQLMKNSSVYCSAGQPTVSIEITPQVLLRLSGGKLASIC